MKKNNNEYSLIIHELLAQGLISQDQLDIAMRIHKESQDKTLERILVELGFITENTLNSILAPLDLKDFDLKSVIIDPYLVKLITKEKALEYKALPIFAKENNIYIALPDVSDITTLDKIKRYLPQEYNKITPIYASEAEIIQLIDQFYGYEMSINSILQEIESGTDKREELESYENPTVRLVDAILIDAVRKNASDIHLEPEQMFVRLRYRVDGYLQQICSFHKDYWNAILVRIKVLSNIDIVKSRTPQDGKISYNMFGRNIDLRISTQPTIHGENVVLRILDREHALLPVSELGFSEYNQGLITKLLKKPEGIIIVTGPTGSGKTTTLYSLLNQINSAQINIMTIEDPVEYSLPMIRQSSMSKIDNMSFIESIRSIMRQDPDVILIGEVRDQQSASSALRASITGHRVFTTLHASDSVSAILRLRDIGVPVYMLSGSITCIISQRLMRRLCVDCKKQYPATDKDCSILNISKQENIYHHTGCKKCFSTGYKGRVAICEVLSFDLSLDELITSGASYRSVVQYIEQKGFISILRDAQQKVLAGISDIDELVNVVDVTKLL
ncbi:GspE/PulE family protein [Candidatus Mesenet endosymbiont of Agriotes lineatus]|uniref:GspE/PulE family protein n=1 Tax=Candidatus Mesenet endosymbiont of Agriotes lineatus TaxID=3077948 RepID=UPI0030D36661